MKKLNYLLLGAAGLLMASCANDDLQAPNGDGLQITVKLPGELSTRADGDNMVLNYAVYDSNNAVVEKGQPTFSGQSTTLNLKLLSGQEYSIAFFAQDVNSSDVYSFDADGQTVSVSYENMTSGDDNNNGVYDCFYGSLPSVKGGDTGVSVILYRPLAQINWGTNDLGEQTVKNTFTDGMYATLQTEAYSSFNIMSGELLGDKETVKLGAWEAPDATFPVGSGYTYVGMEYILAGPTSDLYDLNLYVSNSADGGTTTDVVVTSAPVQANYRTNIYGSLLTDNLSINVELGPWGGDYENVIGAVEPKQDEDGNYLITNQAELTWVADYVNGPTTRAATAPQNINCKLQNDIYMVGNWTPIGIDYTHRYGGTFDGQNYTIYNLNVNSNEMTGLFGFMNGKVQNLNFDNAKIVSNHYAGVVAGYSDNENGTMFISNCTVKNSSVTLSAEFIDNKWDNGDKGGIILGYIVGRDNVTGCTVTNCTLQGYRDLGGIVGYANGASNITDNKVSGLDIYVDNSHNYNNYTSNSDYDANEIVGHYFTSTNTSGSTYENVNIHYDSVLAGSLNAAATGAQAGQDVFLTGNITGNASNTFGYGGNNQGGINLKGGTFDGNNNSLDVIGTRVSDNYWTSVVYANAGTLKNITLLNSNNTLNVGVLVWNVTGDINLENVTIPASSRLLYAMMMDGGNKNNVNVSDSKIYGYASWGNSFTKVSFDGCYFGMGQYYSGNNFYNCMLKMKSNTVFTNCEFDEMLYVDLSALATNATVTFTNCTVNGTVLTLANHKDLLKGWTLDNDLTDWDGWETAGTRVTFN